MRSMLFGALLLCAATAQALETELAIGTSHYCCLTDGVWWQSQFGFSGELSPNSYELGARKRWRDASLHIAYVNLGTAWGSNVAVMRDQDAGHFDPNVPCDQVTRKNCLGHFATKQTVRGVLFGGAYGAVFSGFRLEAEVGQFFYQSKWSATIYCPGECGSQHRFDPAATFESTSAVKRSTYISARLGYARAFVEWRRFTNINGGAKGNDTTEGQFTETGLTSGHVDQLMVGVVFQL